MTTQPLTPYAVQSQAAGRHIMPDLVRGFAVLGIVLVNVAYFSWPGEVTYHDGGLKSWLDSAAYFIVNAFFLFKSYTLFSFMFGVGVAYQILSAQKRGAGFGPRYTRRILGLLILGVLHVAFAFLGDILIIYALLGALLYLFRNLSIKALKRWAAALMILQVAIAALAAAGFYAMAAFDPQGMAADMSAMREGYPAYYALYSGGSFSDIVASRLSEWPGFFILSMMYQGPFILAFFIWGLIAVRSGVLTNPAADIWRKGRRFYLPIGLVLNIIGAAIMHASHDPLSANAMLGNLLVITGSPFLTLGYLGLIAKLAQVQTGGGWLTKAKTFMARGGTATLTAYLLQSIILSLVFSGYGLGQFGKIGAFHCIVIGAFTGVFSLIFVSLWRRKFRYGPFEFLLRRFTYWGDNR